MTPEQKLQLAKQTLRGEIDQLDRWADESLSDGWSTHQVDFCEHAHFFLRFLGCG